jgi:predicted RNase H-like HicB family nuclease
MKSMSFKISKEGSQDVKSYVFRVELEPDEDGWRAFYPPLEGIGASTWGKTQEEALKNIQEVLSMILEEFAEEGKAVPETEQMTVSEGALVSVNV